MSDPNLKWLKTIVQAKERSENKIKGTRQYSEEVVEVPAELEDN